MLAAIPSEFVGVIFSNTTIGSGQLVEGDFPDEPINIVTTSVVGSVSGCTEEAIVAVNLIEDPNQVKSLSADYVDEGEYPFVLLPKNETTEIEPDTEAEVVDPELLVILRGAGTYTKLNNVTFLVDSTPPICEGCIVTMVNELQTDIETLQFTWPQFVDNHTSVIFYDFFVGTSVGLNNARQLTGFTIRASESCNATTSTATNGNGTCSYSWNATESGLSLTPEYNYFVSVVAYNSHGLESESITATNGTFILRFCPLNFWLNVVEGELDDCNPCPDNMVTTRTGVISIEDCICQVRLLGTKSNRGKRSTILMLIVRLRVPACTGRVLPHQFYSDQRRMS